MYTCEKKKREGDLRERLSVTLGSFEGSVKGRIACTCVFVL